MGGGGATEEEGCKVGNGGNVGGMEEAFVVIGAKGIFVPKEEEVVFHQG